MDIAFILDKYFVLFLIFFVLLLVTLFKIIYFNFFFKDDKNWFKKSMKLDFFGEYAEGHWISTALFSYLQLLMLLYIFGEIIKMIFNPHSFLFGFYTPYFLILFIFGVISRIKQNRGYPFLRFFREGKVYVYIPLLLEHIPEKRNGISSGIQLLVDEVVNWTGNYWMGISINEKMIIDRQIKFYLDLKYGIKDRYLRIFQKILDYAVEKDICISIFSLVRFSKDFKKISAQNQDEELNKESLYDETNTEAFEIFKTLSLLTIVYWKGWFYIPGKKRLEHGIFIDSDPVQKIEKDLKRLTAVLNNRRYDEIPVISVKEGQNRLPDINKTALNATGAKSWGDLAFKGLTYTVVWTKDKTYLYFSKLDQYSRWEYDPERVCEFESAEDMGRLAERILEDVQAAKKYHFPPFLRLIDKFLKRLFQV